MSKSNPVFFIKRFRFESVKVGGKILPAFTVAYENDYHQNCRPVAGFTSKESISGRDIDFRRKDRPDQGS
jgi:hypothetical protein